VKQQVVIGIALVQITLTAGGCSRQPEEPFVSSARVPALSPAFQEEIRTILTAQCGTPLAPKQPGDPKADLAHLRLGAAVYRHNCRQCHGVNGDGKGPAAAHLLPRPRDYRPGVFKFTSTTYGAKPLREDLIRTVRRGIAGTSMPSFRLLEPRQLEAVVDYVLVLSLRGELETMLADEAEFDGRIDPQSTPGLIASIRAKWDAARGQVVTPITPMPVFTTAHLAEGKVAFLSKGCSKCHGEDGRGQTRENIGVDIWGNPTKAADLSSGMLRGGTEPLDVYRHISAGINGTPMPSFSGSLQQEPETMWKLAAYVLDLSNQRRKGMVPEAGLLKPLPGVEEPTTAKSAARAGRRDEERARTTAATPYSGSEFGSD
jgi:mono/diheme cytochrome c family protein